jgi:glycosyltransferase involved in cell wall biosynthesis
VTVIALCYNQAPFVQECLESVLAQTYRPVELLVVDDASTDDSAARIREFVAKHPETKAYFHHLNQGNCRSFNEALRQARGEFIVDLACDDVMVPDRLSRQVACLQQRGDAYGVCFSNEARIDERGHARGTFYPIDEQGRSRVTVPDGDVYAAILAESFVPATTLLVRKAVFDDLGGYDESLAYEDFDFWVRSSRTWKYAYLDAVLMHKRRVTGSLGSRALDRRNALLPASLAVCRKAFALNRTPAENRQLARRVRYFLRQSWLVEYFELADAFADLLRQTDGLRPADAFVRWACQRRLPAHGAYRMYAKFRSSSR